MVFQHWPHLSPTCIQVSNAVLRYPTGPFLKGSIKSHLFRLFDGKAKPKEPEIAYITALDGVSLSIQSGARLGIIGRNGAGKSTILRAIAGIYPLEAGVISVSGKLQTLFNIDVGFELESTGRENILYRGLAMGVSPAVIAKREQEIVDFASIGRFIDLPMRTYSSGMTVRLAFAIASYLDGDILLIDEVFGAGDAAFQDRALRRMEGMIDGADIVVFVSHDLNTIQQFCNRVVWLDGGRIVMDDVPSQVVNSYLASVNSRL